MVKKNNPKEILTIGDIKKKAVPLFIKNGVVRAGVFGSYARKEAKRKSDIDILVKFKGRKSYFDLVSLEQKLELRLGKKVDLLTYNSINPHIKKYIDNDEVAIL